jgi:hypothetical protein
VVHYFDTENHFSVTAEWETSEVVLFHFCPFLCSYYYYSVKHRHKTLDTRAVVHITKGVWGNRNWVSPILVEPRLCNSFATGSTVTKPKCVVLAVSVCRIEYGETVADTLFTYFWEWESVCHFIPLFVLPL